MTRATPRAQPAPTIRVETMRTAGGLCVIRLRCLHGGRAEVRAEDDEDPDEVAARVRAAVQVIREAEGCECGAELFGVWD